MSLTTRFPSFRELISLEPEELGPAILIEIKAATVAPFGLVATRLVGGGVSDLRWPEGIGLDAILAPFERENTTAWPGSVRPQVRMAVLEACGWLLSAGLIIPHPQGGYSQSSNLQGGYSQGSHPQGGPSYILTRRGAKLASEQDVADYRDNGILPTGLLHPRIASDVRSHFLHGHYDTAVFHAFRELEIAIREASCAGAHLIGDKLVRFAFDQKDGPLRDPQKVDSERQAEANLIAGAIGCLKNPGSHRRTGTERGEAARLVIFSSHLLYLVDERKVARDEREESSEN
jgi:uncharacterized protein (TIGR02391 family)